MNFSAEASKIPEGTQIGRNYKTREEAVYDR
jgi:hypothetical protein